MRDNCVVFATKDRQEVRAVFHPDGTPFFCGSDLAVLAGYNSPRKAVTGGNQGVNRIDTVLRKVPWDNGMKKGRCSFTCFSAENAVKFLCRRPAPYEAIRWFEDVVLPQAEAEGEKIAREYIKWPRKTAEKAVEQQEGKSRDRKMEVPVAVLDRLDAIILECALLKKELCQTR